MSVDMETTPLLVDPCAQSSTESDMLWACVYANDAINSRESGMVHEGSPSVAVRAFRLAHNRWLRRAVFAAIAVHLCLAFVEAPCPRCREAEPAWKSLALAGVDLALIGVYVADTSLRLAFYGRKAFFADPWHWLKIGCLGVLLIDLLLGVVSTLVGFRWLRVVRCLRAFLLIEKSRGMRNVATSLVRSLVRVVNVFALFFLLVCMFSMAGMSLFWLTPEEEAVFDSFSHSLRHLFVLMTTSNFPDVMMPAYSYHAPASLFFILYVVLVVFIFKGVLLAVVFQGYKEFTRSDFERKSSFRDEALVRAFRQLSRHSDGRLLKETWAEFIARLRPGLGDSDRSSISFAFLDRGGKGYLTQQDFMGLCDLLAVRLHKKKVGDSSKEPSSRLEKVKSIYRIFYTSILASSLLVVCLDATIKDSVFVDKGQYSSLQSSAWFDIPNRTTWCRVRQHPPPLGFIPLLSADPGGSPAPQWVIFAISIFFAADCAWRIIIKDKATRSWWFRVDAALVFASLVFGGLDVVMFDLVGVAKDSFPHLPAIRCLFFVRLIITVEGFRSILESLGSAFPVALLVGSVLGSLFYLYSVVGMELFCHVTDRGSNPALVGTPYDLNNYYRNNFNDLASALTVMFEQLVVNNWFITMDGFCIGTGSHWSRFFFMSWNILAVLVALNVVMACIIDAFVLRARTAGGLKKLETRATLRLQEITPSLPIADSFELRIRPTLADQLYLNTSAY